MHSMRANSDAQPLAELAVRVSLEDNVAVAKQDLLKGTLVEISQGVLVELQGDVTPGNRFALNEIPPGEFVRQYGSPIGTSRGIPVGGAVSQENMSNEVPVVREIPPDLSNPEPDYIALADQFMTVITE